MHPRATPYQSLDDHTVLCYTGAHLAPGIACNSLTGTSDALAMLGSIFALWLSFSRDAVPLLSMPLLNGL